MQLFTQKISIAIFNKNIHNQNDAQKSGQLRYIKKLSIALVQTKVINCNFANKVVSCNLCTQKLSQLRRNLAIFFDFTDSMLLLDVIVLKLFSAENVRAFATNVQLQPVFFIDYIHGDVISNKKIARLRRSCDSFCVHKLKRTTFVCITAFDIFFRTTIVHFFANVFIKYCN